MLFNSLEFLLLFLPAVWVIASRLRGTRLLCWLSLASFVFYAFAGHVWFLIPMTITTGLDFWVGQRLVETRHPRRYLMVSLVGNLGLLAYFKYCSLILGTVESLAAAIGTSTGLPHVARALQVVLPAGISFYTFQTLSYVIDIYRGQSRPEPSFWKYVAFVTFFPHLVAGPLTRHDQLLPQLGSIADTGLRPRWRAGLFLFALGLSKKVLLADRIAAFIDPMISTLPHQGLLGGWGALIGYALQIYFDFSGYSDMAVGLGRLFGIELPQNFDSPYRAINPSDFWRRWHITLSQWLRDYLYISLGGNRRGPMRTRMNLLITMILGGLWHGASWTFALWGAFHGLALVLYHRFERPFGALPIAAQRAVTFLVVCLAWVFFRASSMGEVAHWFAALFGTRGLGPLPPARDGLALAALLGTGLAIAMGARNSFERQLDSLRPPAIASLAVLTVVAVLLMTYSSKFLYFQF